MQIKGILQNYNPVNIFNRMPTSTKVLLISTIALAFLPQAGSGPITYKSCVTGCTNMGHPVFIAACIAACTPTLGSWCP